MFVLEYYVGTNGNVNNVNNMFLVMYEDIPNVVRVEYVYTYNSGAAATIGIQSKLFTDTILIPLLSFNSRNHIGTIYTILKSTSRN